MEKLLVLVFVACLVGSSYQMEDDLVKRLLNLLSEKQEEKRTESAGEIMKRVMTDFDVEKRHSCDDVCDSNSNYKVSLASGNCLCYNKRSDYEKRGCVESCRAEGKGDYGYDINGLGCKCVTKREMVEKRAHSCAGQCQNQGYMVNIGPNNCQCLQRRQSVERRGCSERCKAANSMWGYDVGDGKGCVCMSQRDLTESAPAQRDVQACEVTADCSTDSFCANIGDNKGRHCVGTRELERHYRCARCTQSEECMEVGKKGLRCIKRRDLEDLISRVLEEDF